jgi:hypothetical protein
MRILSLALAAALPFALSAVVSAQTMPQQSTTQQTTTTTTTTRADMGPNGQYGDPMCGTWSSGVWQSNGRCPGYVTGTRRAHVVGTITAVRGHLVTVQQATRTIVINDKPALRRELTGRVAVGRQIDALGYWRDGNFFATVIQ